MTLCLTSSKQGNEKGEGVSPLLGTQFTPLHTDIGTEIKTQHDEIVF